MGLVCLIRALFLSHAFGYSFNGQLAMGVSRGNWGHIPNISKAQKYHNSKCNNGLKVILISSFADVKERREERGELSSCSSTKLGTKANIFVGPNRSVCEEE